MLKIGMACISGCKKQAKTPDTITENPLLTNRSLEIIKAFTQIKNPQISESIYNLITSLNLSPYILNKNN